MRRDEEQEYEPYNVNDLQPASVGMQPNSDKANLLERIRPDAIVDIIRERLLGKELINGEWKDNLALKDRALTEQGAYDIANLMLAVSSQNVSISKLDDHTIRVRALSIACAAQQMCLANWREYGIKGRHQLRFIHEIVFSNTLVTLKQPEGGGIRNLLIGTQTEHHQTITDQSQKKKWSLFGR